MSGFPGPPGYSEVLAAQERAQREEARSEAQWPVVERTADADDFIDALLLRATITTDDKARRLLERAAEYIVTLEKAVEKLREALQRPPAARKEGSDDHR